MTTGTELMAKQCLTGSENFMGETFQRRSKGGIPGAQEAKD